MTSLTIDIELKEDEKSDNTKSGNTKSNLSENMSPFDAPPSQHVPQVDGSPPNKYYKYFHFPTFTILVTIVDVAMFIWVMAIGGFAPPSINPMLGPPPQTLLDAGAKWTPYILEGQWWRIIAPNFLHAGFIHIIMNTVTQVLFGWYLERKFGTIRFAIIYLLSGIGGMLTSAIFIPNLMSVGASGALYGIIAMWCIDLFQDIKILPHPCLTISSVVVLIFVSFAMGLLPYTDNFAHIGGFLFGLELSLILILKYKWDKLWKIRLRYVVAIVATILFLTQFIGFFYLLYNVDVTSLCPNCKYVSCLPVTVNGVDWCGPTV